ncbi:MAG TPA: IS110 family transposase [Gemmataceae bacterium]|nr:IS110 family transposase [Gemmataceae bacterium]
MTTAKTTTTADTILAIDLGKYKSVACAYDRATAQARFDTIPTGKDELRKLLARHRPAVVVIEACTLAGWVHDLCAEEGLTCKVANTASEAWKFKHTKRKTDKDDALRLAQLEALGQLPTVPVPPQLTRQWRALIAYRQGLVGRRVAAQNRIRAILLGQGLPAPRGHRAWTETGLRGIAEHARPLPACGPDELWRGLLDLALTEYRQVQKLLAPVEAKLDERAQADPAVRLLETIPGVGPRTAEAVAAHLHDPGRFASGKQVSAYAGLVPRQYQSGECDHRGRITKRGPALLRKLLVECAWAMLRYNAGARAVYARLSRGKARKKQAIVALARKLLVRCWAMLRDRVPWRDDPPAVPA